MTNIKTIHFIYFIYKKISLIIYNYYLNKFKLNINNLNIYFNKYLLNYILIFKFK